MKKILLFLFCIISCNACYDIPKQIEKWDRDLGPQLTLEPSNKIQANRVDTVRVRINFPPNPNPEFTKVNFTISEGTFVENNKTEYSPTKLFKDSLGFFMYATLKSSTNQGKFQVTAEIPQVAILRAPIEFTPSYPESIKADKNKFAVDRSYRDEIQLIANVTADKGLPHQGTAVTFIVYKGNEAFSSENSPLFRNVFKTDAKGQASALFTPGDFGGYTGPVSYRVVTRNKLGEERSDTGTFNVIEPQR